MMREVLATSLRSTVAFHSCTPFLQPYLKRCEGLTSRRPGKAARQNYLCVVESLNSVAKCRTVALL